MKFEELIIKLQHWIKDEWNPNHTHQIRLEYQTDGLYELYSDSDERPLITLDKRNYSQNYTYFHLNPCRKLGDEYNEFLEDFIRVSHREYTTHRPVLRA